MYELVVCLVCGLLAWLWAGGRGGAGLRASASEAYREQLMALRPRLLQEVERKYQDLGEQCEDAVNEGLAHLLRDEKKVREKVPTAERLFLYARRVVLYKAYDLAYRRFKPEEFPDGDPEALNPVAPDNTALEVERRELSQPIEDALKRLPRMQEQAVRGHYFSDYSCAEIAQVLGTSEKSVTRLLSNGRKGLARLLGDGKDLL